MEPRFAVIALWAEDIAVAAHFYRGVLQLKFFLTMMGVCILISMVCI